MVVCRDLVSCSIGSHKVMQSDRTQRVTQRIIWYPQAQRFLSCLLYSVQSGFFSWIACSGKIESRLYINYTNVYFYFTPNILYVHSMRCGSRETYKYLKSRQHINGCKVFIYVTHQKYPL